MGAWSPKAFDNDTALDMAMELSAASSAREFRDRLMDAFRKYQDYDKRLDRGENKEIWTKEYVDWMLGQLQKPVDPDIKRIMKQGIGKEHADTGADPAFETVAAAAIILAACRDDADAIREATDAGLPLLDEYRPSTKDIQEAIRVLRLIPKNMQLSRDCGAKWKKSVVDLATELSIYSQTSLALDSPQKKRANPSTKAKGGRKDGGA